MNRVFDERLELQLQEYEFAELEQLLPARPLMHAAHQVIAGMALQSIEQETGHLQFTPPERSANGFWKGKT